MFRNLPGLLTERQKKEGKKMEKISSAPLRTTERCPRILRITYDSSVKLLALFPALPPSFCNLR